MKTQLQNNSKASKEALEIVVAELERSLMLLQANYQIAVSNLTELERRVETDDLTRLLRRGAFMEKLLNLLNISKLENREVHLMMIDIDLFKRINDGFGHQTGDVVLERVSELVRSYMRPQDLAGRFGGEEIIVALQMGARDAHMIAEGIRKAVENHRMSSASDSKAEFQVTLSVGIASSQEFGYEADVLIGYADEAMYRAKETGRNKVCAAIKEEEVTLEVERAVA